MKDYPDRALAVRLEFLRGVEKAVYLLTWRQQRELEYATRKSERPRCGAKTRKGAPCKAPAVWDREHDRPRNGRCRMHGGLSTGPKTIEGRLRALANLKQFSNSAMAH